MGKLTASQVGRKYGFRSGLEERNAKRLEDLGVPFEYEKLKIHYTKPITHHTYTPDFVLPNGIIVETKGRFTPADRKKHILVKTQCPHLDIRFVFTNPKAKIRKGSKTTYAVWCTKQGFKYAKEMIPLEWIKEKPKGTKTK
jgi:hypothetical protein